jgi:hypothetical protein
VVAQVIPTRNTGGLYVVGMDRWSELQRHLRTFDPKTEIGRVVQKSFKFLPTDLAQEMLDAITRCVIFESKLEVVVNRHPNSPYRIGRSLVEDYGVTSRRKVTTQGVTALCAAWGTSTFGMIYMMLGTASAAEANTDTRAGMTEITSTHYTTSVRPTCTHAESTNTIPIVGTHTQATAGDTIAEQGVVDGATPAAGLLWDRSLTGTIVLAVADGLTGTYTLTASAEA